MHFLVGEDLLDPSKSGIDVKQMHPLLTVDETDDLFREGIVVARCPFERVLAMRY
ncbi:hypothetical protein SCLCIDRAFT_24661 [Scleroderma citrinum Foug A]|uniref:Uncharacterized protein n=1 Tax=Scleroderma citrinum Foug A TaxID=1036808 RepID=A0A0C2ZMM0_9AGAM|nr:hypothetical protein SCLCIDRAFT_24661 [Scleroderma citrinum Foug A]